MQVINRIKALEQQISTIEKILKRGEYNAAGISMTVHVGPLNEDRSPELNLELSCTLDPVLEAIHKSLTESLAMNMTLGRRELADLQAFFGQRA
jgi:hypothetical protein